MLETMVTPHYIYVTLSYSMCYIYRVAMFRETWKPVDKRKKIYKISNSLIKIIV